MDIGISTREEFDQILMAEIFEINNDIANRAKEELLQKIEDIVYNPYYGMNRVYRRRHDSGEIGFYESWSIGYPASSAHSLTSEIYSDGDVMDEPYGLAWTDPEDKGNLSRQDLKNRNEILDRIIAEGTDWDYYVKPDRSPYGEDDNWWTRPRDYMTPTLSFLDSNIDSITRKILFDRNIEIS